MQRSRERWYSRLEVFVRDAAARRPLEKALWLRGAPGVGKTTALHAIADQHATTLVVVDSSAAFNLQRILFLVTTQPRTPTIIVVDDADALLNNECMSGTKTTAADFCSLAGQRVPLILVSSDDISSSSLLIDIARRRDSPFVELRVPPLSALKLAELAMAYVPTLDARRSKAIGEECQGDARQAIALAQLDSVADRRLNIFDATTLLLGAGARNDAYSPAIDDALGVARVERLVRSKAPECVEDLEAATFVIHALAECDAIARTSLDTQLGARIGTAQLRRWRRINSQPLAIRLNYAGKLDGSAAVIGDKTRDRADAARHYRMYSVVARGTTVDSAPSSALGVDAVDVLYAARTILRPPRSKKTFTLVDAAKRLANPAIVIAKRRARKFKDE